VSGSRCCPDFSGRPSCCGDLRLAPEVLRAQHRDGPRLFRGSARLSATSAR
jgi:hypothetical protein